MNRSEITREAASGRRLTRVLAAATLLVGVTAHGTEADAPPGLDRDILPLLKVHCIKCHGPNKPKGKLNLASPRALARGGASGPVVVAGRPDESLLWDQVSSGEMPPEPEEPLSGDEK
jgi:mono/diheme cytochrome c family protein